MLAEIEQRNPRKYREYPEQSDSESDDDDSEQSEKCEHSKEEVNGIVMCIICGEEFEDEVVRIANHYRNCTSLIVNCKWKNPIVGREPAMPPNKIIEETTKGITELKKIPKERKIRYCSRMNKKELCKAIGLRLAKKPHKFIFKNKKTGEERGFCSLYKAGKELGVNPGLISYYLGK